MQNEPFDQLDPPPKPKMPLGKVLLLNFGIMLIYMLFTSFAMDSGAQAGMAVLVLDVVLVLAQAGLNLLIGFILVFTDKKQLGGALMIGALIIGVTGLVLSFFHVSLLDSML